MKSKYKATVGDKVLALIIQKDPVAKTYVIGEVVSIAYNRCLQIRTLEPAPQQTPGSIGVEVCAWECDAQKVTEMQWRIARLRALFAVVEVEVRAAFDIWQREGDEVFGPDAEQLDIAGTLAGMGNGSDQSVVRCINMELSMQSKETEEDGVYTLCKNLMELECHARLMGYSGTAELARNAGVKAEELVGVYFTVVHDRVYFEGQETEE